MTLKDLVDEVRDAYRDRWRLLAIAKQYGAADYGPEWRAYHESVTRVCVATDALIRFAAGDQYEGPRE